MFYFSLESNTRPIVVVSPTSLWFKKKKKEETIKKKTLLTASLNYFTNVTEVEGSLLISSRFGRAVPKTRRRLFQAWNGDGIPRYTCLWA